MPRHRLSRGRRLRTVRHAVASLLILAAIATLYLFVLTRGAIL